MKRIGVTGTRHGMTNAQAVTFTLFLGSLATGFPVEFHHGDCVGVDEQSFYLVNPHLDFYTVAHPPLRTTLRAWTASDRVEAPADYLDRNRAIVNATDLLIAFPRESVEPEDGGGTWYTVRYARKSEKPVTIVWPDGAESHG